MMRKISSKIPFNYLLIFITSFTIHFIPGLSDDSASSKDGTDVDAQSASGVKKGSNAFIIIIMLIVVVLLSLVLYKVWQKKKREEQYAQLIKLFEEDDELELELGLRD
ncbi:hypothetical protein Leryth_011885 [Lithospermum erythrorhizon]|nr:hypothetical protein Leryth_011885 [Lithospermum erythrorhizon]